MVDIMLSNKQKGRMLCVHVIPNDQTNKYWANAIMKGLMVLNEYNNCVVGCVGVAHTLGLTKALVIYYSL